MFNFRGLTPFHYFAKPTLSLNFRETQPDWGGSAYTVYCSSFNAEWPETGGVRSGEKEGDSDKGVSSRP